MNKGLILGLLIVSLLVVGCITTTGDLSNEATTTQTPATSTPVQNTPVQNDQGGEIMTNTLVKIETNHGYMIVRLYDDKAPITTTNFKKLVSEGFYDGTRFHRVIKDFMIQGGDPLTKDVSKQGMWGTGGPGYSIEDEFSPSLSHSKKGVLSMANSGPNSGGSQFFITLAATPWLNNKHAIFGEIKEGMNIVEKIGAVATEGSDRPVEEVVITTMSVVEG